MKNHTLSFRLLFLRDIPFFANMFFFLVFGRTLIPECAYRPSTSGKIMKNHGKAQVESWVWGFSLIFDFSVYLKNSSRITFPSSGGGPCSRSLRCQKVHVRYCVRSVLRTEFVGFWQGPEKGPIAIAI